MPEKINSIPTRPHRNFPHPVRDASLGKTEQRHDDLSHPVRDASLGNTEQRHDDLSHPVRDASLGNTEQRYNNPCIPLGMQPNINKQISYAKYLHPNSHSRRVCSSKPKIFDKQRVARTFV